MFEATGRVSLHLRIGLSDWLWIHGETFTIARNSQRIARGRQDSVHCKLGSVMSIVLTLAVVRELRTRAAHTMIASLEELYASVLFSST